MTVLRRAAATTHSFTIVAVDPSRSASAPSAAGTATTQPTTDTTGPTGAPLLLETQHIGAAARPPLTWTEMSDLLSQTILSDLEGTTTMLHQGVRAPLAGAFAVTASGMTLLAHVGESGSYLRDVLPGMLIAGAGLGVAVVSVSVAILTGAREEETGMLSGLNSTGHEIGGSIGIAVFSTIAAGTGGALAGSQAASGIAHAFVAAGLLASVASLVALAVLPRSRHFLPKLRMNPIAIPTH